MRKGERSYDDVRALSDDRRPKFDGKWVRPNKLESVVMRAQAGLGETTEADVLFLLNIVKRQASIIESARRVLDSEDFRCPGGHWSRELTDTEWMIYQHYLNGPEWDHDGKVIHPDPLDELVFNDYERDAWYAVVKNGNWYVFPEFDKAEWIREGQCEKMITIGWDTEYGDYGTVYGSWPVPDGDCALAMRLIDRFGCTAEDFESHSVMQAWSERHWLKGEIFKSMIHGTSHMVRDLEHDVSRLKSDLQYTRNAQARALWREPRES